MVFDRGPEYYWDTNSIEAVVARTHSLLRRHSCWRNTGQRPVLQRTQVRRPVPQNVQTPARKRVETSLDPAGRSARATGLAAVYDPVALGRYRDREGAVVSNLPLRDRPACEPPPPLFGLRIALWRMREVELQHANCAVLLLAPHPEIEQ
jgi:hypothetical protein